MMINEEMFDMNVVKAMHRIEKLYEDTEGQCYVSFSGGKDSTVVLALIKMCYELGTVPDNSIPAVFCNTKIELDATYDFIKWVKENWYRNLEILDPEIPFSQVLKLYGKPLKSKMRSKLIKSWHYGNMAHPEYLLDKNYRKTCIADKDLHMLHEDFRIVSSPKCCDILKKKPFEKYAKQHDMTGYITGERLAEGGARATVIKRNIDAGKAPCTKITGNYMVKMPIVDWSDDCVDAFIEKYSIKLSDAYTTYGMTRTGCCCCPYGRNIEDDLRVLYEYEPNKYKASMFWLKDVYIAQNVVLQFDSKYEEERREKWENEYDKMRYDMLKKYRPDCRLCKKYEEESRKNVAKEGEKENEK